jgi:hypothetical protein
MRPTGERLQEGLGRDVLLTEVAPDHAAGDQLVEGALGPLRDLGEPLGAGVVDRAVQAAVGLDSAGDERLHLLLARDVGRPDVDLSPGRSGRGRGCLPQLGVAVAPTTVAPAFANASARTAPHPRASAEPASVSSISRWAVSSSARSMRPADRASQICGSTSQEARVHGAERVLQ